MYHGTLLGTDRPTGASGKSQELSTFHVSQETSIFVSVYPRSLYQSRAKKQFSFGKTHMHTHTSTRD